MISLDTFIAIGAGGLIFVMLPTLLNSKSQVPRLSSILTASLLSYMTPLFFLEGLWFTGLTLAGEAIVWWLVVVFRPMKKSPNPVLVELATAPFHPDYKMDVEN